MIGPRFAREPAQGRGVARRIAARERCERLLGQVRVAAAQHPRAAATLRIIPSSPQPLAPTQLSLCLAPGLPDELREAASIPRRIGWAGLLARVFAVDVTVCSKCGGRMKILEVVTDPEAITRLLHGARAPPRPCLTGQLGLFI